MSVKAEAILIDRMNEKSAALAGDAMTDDADASGKERSMKPIALSQARPGTPLCVRAVAGSPGFVRRMMDLGLRAGAPIRVVQRTPAGVVIGMDGMRMAVSPAAGRDILVSPCPKGARDDR